MLPSLTVALRRSRIRGLLPALGGSVLLLTSVGSLLWPSAGGTPDEPAVAPRIAQGLEPSTWAIAVPVAWFSTPLVGVAPGDRVDVLALEGKDGATADAVAVGLRVMRIDGQVIVFGAAAPEAAALAAARANGEMIVPLVRSER